MVNYLFEGAIIHCKVPFQLEIINHGYLYVVDNKIKFIGTEKPDYTDNNVKYIKLSNTEFLMPGLIDTHIHAPQYPNVGLGYHLELLKWLDNYTFPQEAKFKNVEYAEKIYTQVVNKTVKCGTTTACYFATSHLESSLILANIASKKGQRCFIGLVNMIQNAPNDVLQPNIETSICNTEIFIKEIFKMDNPLVKPVITPRFALSCNMDLLKKLGKLAQKYDVHIQTHISENKTEIEETLKLYSDCTSYADIYDKANLLTKKTILAHAVYLTPEEKELLSKRETSVAHCPISNTYLHSGICDIRDLINSQVTVGLGTDVAGGAHPSIIDVMRNALEVSNHCDFQKTKDCNYKFLNYQEVFYLATLGGAKALALDDVIGNFAEGKEFDALLIDVGAKYGRIDLCDTYSLDDLLQKFIYLGDDKNVKQVFVAGKSIHELMY